MVIANNVLSIFACDGMTWGSLTNSYIGYNTVISDRASGQVCQPTIDIGATSHEGGSYPSHNELVTGNLASGLATYVGPPNWSPADLTIVVTGNVATGGVGGPALYGGRASVPARA
jgi:hypothetical protein